VLSQEQRPLAELFGSVTGRDRDKFAACEWDDGPYGLPILRHAAGWFAGPTLHIASSGDHDLFIVSPQIAHGRVDDPAAGGRRPRRLHGPALHLQRKQGPAPDAPGHPAGPAGHPAADHQTPARLAHLPTMGPALPQVQSPLTRLGSNT